ncbi:MAG: hypothetical protein HFI34_00830 [Lachnospiraceae bacterium]|nr:hypothetical protein [Lachnospiraceae bacterium]
MKKRNKKEILNLAFDCGIILVGIFSFLLVLYYVIFVARGYYHSDCTDTILWAEASLDAKALMNQDFAYACLLPFGGQLLMLPFVAVFGVGMKAQILGMTLFYLIFVIALIYFAKALNFSIKWIAVLLSSLLLLVSASEKLREIFWGHIIYYSLGILFLMVGAALVFRIIQWDKINVLHMLALFLWTVLCSMNGIQAIAIYALPVLAAVAAERFFDFQTGWKDNSNISRYAVLVLLALGILAGVLAGSKVNGNLTAGYAEAYSSFSKSSEWIGNLGELFPSFMSLLGVDISDNTLLYSREGIFHLLRIICALLLLTVPVVMACMYRKFESKAYHLMIFIHHFMTLLILMGWVFGKLNSANWRLSPIVATSVILCVMFVRWIFQNTSYKRLLLLIVVPITCVWLITSYELLTMEKQTRTNEHLNDLAEYLEENDLEYGYATFWYANIITMMSDSRVKVRGISLEEDGYRKRLYQTNTNWYEDIDGYDKYFVILSNREMEEYYNQPQYDYEKADEILKCGVYNILIYDYNIMK